MSYLDQITVGSTTYDIKDANAIAAPSSATVDAVLAYNGTGWIADKRMVILSYGSSTWQNFIDAYNNNAVIYCRASSNSNPATGTQGRLAFMAYVNNGDAPTNVEFQYYRSVNSHSVTQQGDQTYIYKLDKNSGWSVTTRENYTKIVAGTGLSQNYSSGVLTLSQALLPSISSSDNGKTITVESGAWALSSFPTELPAVSSSDNGKVLRVTSGAWAAVELPSASGVSF